MPKLTALPNAATLDGTEIVPVSQGAVVKQTTTQDIADLGSSSALSKWFNVEDYGAVAGSESTTAVQNAISACGAAGGGTVYFPNVGYIIGGALQDTSGANAQLTLPVTDNTTESPQILFQGAKAPSSAVAVAATPAVPTGTLISTLASGTGALLGGYNASGFDDFTHIEFFCRDMSFQTVANPTITALDLSHVNGIDLDRVMVFAGSFGIPSISAQTTATSYGIKTPEINNGAHTRLGAVDVIGFYNGYQVNEHTTGEMVAAWACTNAAVFTAAYHASYFSRFMAIHCKNGLVAIGGAHRTQIDQFDIEHASSGTWTPVSDVSDSSDFLFGNLRWHVVLAGTGVDGTFTVTGASNLQYTRLGVDAALSDAPSDGSTYGRKNGAWTAVVSGNVGQLNGINDQTGTSYTLVLTDVGKDVRCTNAAAVTLTVPPNSSVAFPVGTMIALSQGGAGAVTATAGAGVTVNAANGAATTAQYDARVLEKVGTDTWRVW